MTVEEEMDWEVNGDFSFNFEDTPNIPIVNKSFNGEIEEDGKFDILEKKLAKIRAEKKIIFADQDGPLKQKKGKKRAKNAPPSGSDEENGEDDYLQEVTVRRDNDGGDDEYFDDKAEFDLGQNISTFSDLNLSRPLLKGLSSLKFEKPTPIQKTAIPVALMGKDICGGAVTGSGKTAAFLIPIIERLLHRNKSSPAATRVVILLPTRELAVQCHQVSRQLAQFTDIQSCLAAGGLPMRIQEAELRRNPEIVIATPGRLIDHLRNSANFSLESVEILVLDEADRMLEEGFADELNEIIKYCPTQRQTILFSATMTDNVDELVRLSLKKPVRIFVDSNTAIARKLQQEFVRIRAEHESDRLAILLALCRRTCTDRCIVFFPTKELAHRFRLILGLAGLKAAELHGGLSQIDRIDALERFKKVEVDYLVATDVAARGLDIPGIQFVLNYSMPANYKLYLHRVGRTARAGKMGRSVTLVGEGADRKLLKMVIKNSTETVKHRHIQPTVIEDHRQIIDSLDPTIDSLLQDEKEAKLLERTEKDLRRAENLMEHGKEIKSRPKKTWFQSEKQKKISKKRDIKALGDDRSGKV